MRRLRFAFVLMLTLGVRAKADDRKDTAVEPTSWGQVVGQVYEARSGAPIRGASVAVAQSGEFASSGKTTGTTDAEGRYTCQAMLGRVSENFDVGRALSGGLVSLLVGGATNRTRRIDVTRLNLRVARDGFEPFEGPVFCRSLEPGRFRVALEPVLLTPAGGGEASTAAQGWGVVRVAEARVEPPILHPGDRALIRVRVQSPPVLKAREMKVVCRYVLDGEPREKTLKPQEGADAGAVVFTGDFGVGRSSKAQADDLVASIVSCPYDVAAGGESASALLQVAPGKEDERAAGIRSEAFRLQQAEQNAEAAARYRELCALPAATLWDHQQMASVAGALHDSEALTAALRRVVELTPPKPEAARLARTARYAAALVDCGESATVLRDIAPQVEAIKERDRPDRVPVPLMVAIGQAYVREGRLQEAEKISQALDRWPDPGLYAGTGDFRNALRLAQAQARTQAAPADAAARADYGRVLMDLGRWEEACAETRAALQADPSLPSARRDLAYAALHLQGERAAAPDDLDAAIAEAEKQVVVSDRKGKTTDSKDFRSWHALAMLLYARARKQQAEGDPAAPAALARCREALRKALRCSRTGAAVNEGFYFGLVGYTSPRLVAIAGFAYPEADSDFVVLESLTDLDRRPDDYLAHLNLAAALVDLGQPALAAAPAARALALRPDCVEAKYATALADLQAGDRAAAAARLEEVLKANPRHPRANLALARLLTEDGDAAGAAACLAAHAATYGATR